ncbi:MAG: hypothetical protein ABIJ46_05405 [bacterium]
MFGISWHVLALGCSFVVLIPFIAWTFFLIGNRHKKRITKPVEGTEGAPYRSEALVIELVNVSWTELTSTMPHCVRSRAWFMTLTVVLALVAYLVSGYVTSIALNGHDLNVDQCSEEESTAEQPSLPDIPNPSVVYQPSRKALSTNDIHILSVLYRVTGETPDHIRPVELSRWYVEAPWGMESESLKVRKHRRQRLEFFLAVIEVRNNPDDADLLASYLLDFWSDGQTSHLCFDNADRFWFRVGIMLALRKVWPVRPLVLQVMFRVAREVDDIPASQLCSEDDLHVLQFIATETLLVWQNEHPEEFASLVGNLSSDHE